MAVDYSDASETSSDCSRLAVRRGREGNDSLPVHRGVMRLMRYGKRTVVLSPIAEITKVPDAVSLANAYGLVHPAGGLGICAMNGPADWLRELTATVVSAARPALPLAGTAPMWAA